MINKTTRHLFIVISIITALLIIASFMPACSEYASSTGEHVNTETKGDPEFLNSTIELMDINGGDIYPGESLKAIIKVINSGEATANNVSLDLILPEILLPSSGNNGADNNATISIDTITPGEIIDIEVPLTVAREINLDRNASFKMLIDNGKLWQHTSEVVNLTVFGVAPYKRDQVPIIGLHAIEDSIAIPIELSTYHFEFLCRTLKKFGFETITFTDLLNHLEHGRVLPEKSVIITSDDGFSDLYSNAFNVLKKYDYKMAVFLVTDFIKENDSQRVTNYFDIDRPVLMRPMLIWPEVIEMADYGCEFLSHSANHVHLGMSSDEEFTEELLKSKKDIESHLGTEVLFFAWPYDNNDPAKLKLLPDIGYKGAVRYWGGIENISTLNLKEIKRIEFNSLINPEDYTNYLNLHSVLIEGSIENKEIKKDEDFLLEYKIKNNDNMDLQINSIELELPEGVIIERMDQNSFISEYPGYSDGKYMWVSNDYLIGAHEEINIGFMLAGKEKGNAVIKLSITAYSSYINADDIEIKIK